MGLGGGPVWLAPLRAITGLPRTRIRRLALQPARTQPPRPSSGRSCRRSRTRHRPDGRQQQVHDRPLHLPDQVPVTSPEASLYGSSPGSPRRMDQSWAQQRRPFARKSSPARRQARQECLGLFLWHLPGTHAESCEKVFRKSSASSRVRDMHRRRSRDCFCRPSSSRTKPPRAACWRILLLAIFSLPALGRRDCSTPKAQSHAISPASAAVSGRGLAQTSNAKATAAAASKAREARGELKSSVFGAAFSQQRTASAISALLGFPVSIQDHTSSIPLSRALRSPHNSTSWNQWYRGIRRSAQATAKAAR